MKKKVFRTVLLGIFTILSVFAFSYNNRLILFEEVKYFKVEQFLNAGQFVMLILSIVFYKIFNIYYFKEKKEHNVIFKFLAFLLAFFMLFGFSFEVAGNWNLIFGDYKAVIISIIAFIGFFLFFNAIISLLFDYINKVNFKYIAGNNKTINEVFEKHSFKLPIVIMLVCWLPYIISFFPVIMSPDPANQIKQFFGIETRYIEGVKLVDENVLITNDNPVLHTFILGSCVKIGRDLFNSDNIGLFIYSIIQISALLMALAYTIKYMKKIQIPYPIRIGALIIYSLVPVFPFYSMSCVKDVFFTCLVVVYGVQLFDLVKNRNKDIYSIKRMVLLILLCFLITLTRNNGIYLIIMSSPFLLLIEKKKFKVGIVVLIPIIVYYMFINLLLPVLKITPGNKREMLSIPFQQTARYVRDHSDEITAKEREVIDKILNYDTLAERYSPVLADPVKNEFNALATDEELKAYFKVWFNGLIKHPGTYIQSVMHNTYGYFYPNTSNWYIYHGFSRRLEDAPMFNYHYNNLVIPRNILSGYGIAFPLLPGIGLLVNIGFCTWLIMTMIIYIIKLKKYRYLIMLTPAISLILVCVASPANTYFRYSMPYIFSLPILFALFISIVNENHNVKSN